MILLGEMRDLETISTRDHRRRDRPPRARRRSTRDAAAARSTASSTCSPADSRSRSGRSSPRSLQGIVTQALLPTADGGGPRRGTRDSVPRRRDQEPDRQGKTEQIYSYMQTGTKRGMQTMEQALADYVLRSVITREEALTRSTRQDQLVGMLEGAQRRQGSACGWREADRDVVSDLPPRQVLGRLGRRRETTTPVGRRRSAPRSGSACARTTGAIDPPGPRDDRRCRHDERAGRRGRRPVGDTRARLLLKRERSFGRRRSGDEPQNDEVEPELSWWSRRSDEDHYV